MDEAPPDFDDELKRLLRSLTLSGGFNLYLASCDDVSLADRVVTAIDERLPALRKEPVRARRIAVSFSGTRRSDIDRQQLVERVLGALTAPPDEDAARAFVHVLDLTRAHRFEENDWVNVFQRLNEARNVITKRLKGELVVLLLPWMTDPFARAAPDVRAITAGTEFVFAFPTVALESVVGQRESEPPPAEVPTDPVELRAATLDALRQAEHALDHASGDRAALIIERALGLAQAWVLRLPNDRDAGAALADALTLASQRAERAGDTGNALALARDAENRARLSASSTAPPEVRAKRVLLAERVGTLSEQAGRRTDAIEAYERAWADAADLDEAARFELGLRLMSVYRPLGESSRYGRIAGFLHPLATSLGPAATARLSSEMAMHGGAPTPPRAADPRVGASLPPPGATYRRDWYVSRPALERVARSYLAHPGAPLALVGAAAEGKTWLSEHLLDEVGSEPGTRVARVDLRQIARDERASFATFADGLLHVIATELDADPEKVERIARDTRLTPILRVTDVVASVLRVASGAVYLVLDVPDDVLMWSGWRDLEGMLRSWNDRATSGAWARLRILLVLSTSPAIVTKDTYGSPFRVAQLDVGDLAPDEVDALARRYGVTLTPDDLARLRPIVGGHPMLLSAVFHAMSTGGVTLESACDPLRNKTLHDALPKAAPEFARHTELRDLLGAIVRSPGARVDATRERDVAALRSAGLIEPSGEGWAPRLAIFSELLR